MKNSIFPNLKLSAIPQSQATWRAVLLIIDLPCFAARFLHLTPVVSSLHCLSSVPLPFNTWSLRFSNDRMKTHSSIFHSRSFRHVLEAPPLTTSENMFHLLLRETSIHPFQYPLTHPKNISTATRTHPTHPNHLNLRHFVVSNLITKTHASHSWEALRHSPGLPRPQHIVARHPQSRSCPRRARPRRPGRNSPRSDRGWMRGVTQLGWGTMRYEVGKVGNKMGLAM